MLFHQENPTDIKKSILQESPGQHWQPHTKSAEHSQQNEGFVSRKGGVNVLTWLKPSDNFFCFYLDILMSSRTRIDLLGLAHILDHFL